MGIIISYKLVCIKFHNKIKWKILTYSKFDFNYDNQFYIISYENNNYNYESCSYSYFYYYCVGVLHFSPVILMCKYTNLMFFLYYYDVISFKLRKKMISIIINIIIAFFVVFNVIAFIVLFILLIRLLLQ